jgi:energy-coupling factor transporter transmembrane protein EcfT
MIFCFVLFFCDVGIWTEGLHLVPLHQPYFHDGFFEIGSLELFDRDWLGTVILLISASWVARITGMSHQHLVVFYNIKIWINLLFFSFMISLYWKHSKSFPLSLLSYFISSFFVQGLTMHPKLAWNLDPPNSAYQVRELVAYTTTSSPFYLFWKIQYNIVVLAFVHQNLFLLTLFL